MAELIWLNGEVIPMSEARIERTGPASAGSLE